MNLLNQVETCVNLNEEQFVLGSVFHALIGYTRYHFQREERLQELCAYDGLAVHREAHSRLTARVEAFSRRFATDPDSIPATEVREFLRGWLTEHILEQDFAYRDACANSPTALAEIDAMAFTTLSGAPQASRSSWERLRVLVVDDNWNFVRLLTTVLRAAGVRCIQTADKASKGLEQADRDPADVILCDWIMDDMNGGEFVREIRRRAIPAKVILITGFSSADIRRRAGDVGCDVFLEKPFTPFDLFQAISGVLVEQPAVGR